MDSSYSLADIRAAVDGGDCFGGGMGGGWFAWILLFALFGGGGFGFGGRNQAATTDELSAGFNFAGINNKLNELTAGQASINQNLGNAICTSTYELASKIDNCCCNTQLGVQQVRYDMAVQNGDIKSLIHSEAEATRNMMRDTENANLRQQLNYAQMQGLFCGIPRINPYGYGVYAYPTCGGYTGCGCGTNI